MGVTGQACCHAGGWAPESEVSAVSIVMGRRPLQQATTAVAVEFRKTLTSSPA